MQSKRLRAVFIALVAVAAAASPAKSQMYVRTGPPGPPRQAMVPRPGPGFVWTPGYQSWLRNRWVWTPGRWTRPPRGMRNWVPGQWVASPRGWHWRPGRWVA